MRTTLDEMKDVVVRVLGEGHVTASVGDDDDLIEGLGLDSMQMIRLLLEVEERFGVALDFERLDLSLLRSVRVFSGFVEGLVRDQAPP